MAFLDSKGLERLWSKILLKFADKQYVKDSIDSVEIGGRNLLLNTNQGVIGWTFHKSGEVNYTLDTESTEDGTLAVKLTTNTDPPSWAMLTYNLGRTLQKLEPNTDYVLSFDLKTNTDVAISCSLTRTSATGNLSATDNLWYDPIANESWEHVEWHFTTNSLETIGEAGQPDQVVYFGVQDGIGYRTIKDLKLEKGNKATGWSAAPEDWSGTVKYTTAQNLSEARKAQARENIGAMSADTVIPSLSGYATETYVNNAVSSKSNIGHTHSATDITNFGYLRTHPEYYQNTIIPFIHNDLAFLDKKGGSWKYYTTTDTDFTMANLNEQTATINSFERVFDGSSSYAYVQNSPSLVVIDLHLNRNFDYSNTFYIDFGVDIWAANSISLYAMQSGCETNYTLKASTTSLPNGTAWFTKIDHANNPYYGFDKLRIVLSNFSGDNPRIAEIGLINYNSEGVANTFVSRGGCNGIYGDLLPHYDSNINLGSSSKKWNNVYTNKINDKGVVTSSDSTPMEIVASGTQPTPVLGKTIIWIDTSQSVLNAAEEVEF